MSRTRLAIAIMVSVVLVSVLLSIATNIATSALPESWPPYTWLAWPAVFLLTVMTIGLSVWQVRLDRPADDSRAAEPVSSNRRRMLEVVRKTWIDGYLKHSLYNLTRIELGLKEKPDAVRRPFDLSVQQPSRAPRPLPPDQPMSAIFDELGQALLILGAPGAGKTTLLLELARDLLDRAVQDATHPIPVVFHLSSWAVRRRPLVDWLVDELTERYYVPRKLAKAWTDAEHVLPLLDGLDEVAPEHRAACVEAINTFRRRHGLVPLAVCSRAADYQALLVRLELSEAVVIEPLSRVQVSTYLKQAGKSLTGVRTVLRDDETLWELLETPLMLSIVALAYQGRSAEEVRATGSLEQRRTHLFKNYTRKMFERRTEVTEYTREQTIRWLTWLARSLMHNNLSIFYVEWMQPDWLPSHAQRWIVAIVPVMFSGLVSGLAIGLAIGLGVGLGESLLFGLGVGLGESLLSGLRFGLVSGLLFGLGSLLLGLMDGGLDRITPADTLRWSWREARRFWVFVLGVVLVIGLVFKLLGGLGLGEGLLFVLGLDSGLGLGEGLLFVLGLDSGFGLGVGLGEGLLFGLAIVLVFGLVFGFTTDQIVTRTIPNEGIRRSLQNALISLLTFGLLGLVVGPIFGLVAGLVFGLAIGLAIGLAAGLTVGLFGGLVAGLENGGFAYFKHYALRFLLWCNDYAPWNYIWFLDYATERVFLLKVGGGYIFTHRLMMEYFATLQPTDQAGQTKTKVP